MAYPAFKAVSNAAGHSATTAALTVAWPTGHASGDFALLFIERAGGSAATSLSTPAGFVQIGTDQTTGTTTAGTKIGVYWCRATSGAMTSPVIAASADHQYAVMLTFTGVDTGSTPIDASTGGVKAAASTTATLPAVTTTGTERLIVYGIAGDLDATAAWVTSVTNANLTSITERFDAGTTSGLGGKLGVYTGQMATAASTGTATATVTSSINAFMTIALKPFVPPAPLAPRQVTQYDNDHTTVTAPGESYASSESPYLDFDVMLDTSEKMQELVPQVEIEKVGTAFNNTATHTSEDPMIWNSDIPAPRRGGQVVYDSVRERFIVFYGAVGSGYLTDVYELSARDTAAPSPKWRKLSPTGTAPPQRYYFGAGFDHGNNRMYLFGGYNGADLNDFWELSFANGRDGIWTQRTPSGTAPAARGNIGQSTAYDAREQKFWVFGGWGAAYYNDLQQLDLSTSVPAWSALKANGAAGSPGIRRNALMVHDKPSNRLIIYGGNTSGTANKNDTWQFDLSNNTFTQLSPTGTPPPIAELQTGVYDSINDRMLVTGGWTGTANTQQQGIFALSLSTTNGAWTDLSDGANQMPLATYGGVSDVDTKHGFWYHFGGVGADGSGNIETQRDWTVDLNTNTSAPVSVTSLNKNTYFRALDAPGFAFNPDRNEMMFAGGYSNMTDDATITTGDHMNSIYVYNPIDNVWRNAALNLHGFFPREGQLLVYDTNRDRFVLFGGYNGDGIGLNDTYEIKANSAGDYAVKRLRPTGTLPTGRWLMAGAYDATNDRIVITNGGAGYQGANLNDVWELSFSGSADGAWTQRTPSGTAPTATWGSTYANDTTRRRLYMVGGTTSNGGSTFTNIVRYLDYTTTNCSWVTALATGPSARRSGVMVFDSTNDRMMFFAGYPSADNNETWFYNIVGNTWAQAVPAASPPARRSHGGAFYNGKMYIASGRPQSGTWLSDTWELTPNYATPNSSTWVNEQPKIYQRASVRVPNLDAGDYHWQAWASWSGSAGAKTSYGGNLESATDFTVTAPTLKTFEIAAVMSNTGSSTGVTSVCLWNRTDNVMVANSEISTTNNYPTLIRGTFEYNETNFTTGKDYEFRVKTTGGTANVWGAKLFVRLKNMKKATTWNRVSKFGFSALSAAAATTGNRFLYTAADYSSPTAYWEATGVEDTNGTNAFWLLDLNATDVGTTGTDMAGTGIDVNTNVKTRARVSPVTITDTDRYIGVFRYTSGGARYHHGILGITSSSATAGINNSSIIELMDTARSSQITLDWEPRAARTPFNPNDYDNATFYFEAIGTNSHATLPYTITLVAANPLGQETKVATQVFPAATSSGNVRYRTGAITFPNGTSELRVIIPGTAAAKNVLLSNARVIVKQTGGTKAVLQIPMGGSNNEENTQIGWPIVTTTQSTYGVLANNVDQFTIWRRDDSEFDVYFGASTIPQFTKTHFTDAFKKVQGTRSHTTDADMRTTLHYSKGAVSSLPTTSAPAAEAFTKTEVTNVASDNSVYTDEAGSGFLLYVFERWHTNSTDQITATWNGKTTKAPSTSTVYLQIWNKTSSSWETIDSNNTAATNTDFTLTGSKTTGLTNYYDTGNKVVFRVYQ